MDPTWLGLQRILKVERLRSHQGMQERSISYYISSLSPQVPASDFSAGIGCHCGIEVMHYIKDTRFGEDKSNLGKGDTASNMSVVGNIAINLFRDIGNKSVAGSIRQLGHDIKGLGQIILE